MADPSGLTPLPFLEAIEWARTRQVVLREDYYGKLQGLARAQAFTITGLTSLDQLQAVADSLTRVLETGETFRDWQQRVRSGEIPLEVGTAQMETIFRNNIQQSYNRGRYEQQAANLATHPIYMYDAVNDSRTRPSHAAMDGFVAPADDPTWLTWTPACGHRCRCRRVALTERQAARYLEQDAERLRDPEFRAERDSAKIHGPDKGWEYDVYRDPNAGLKKAVERRRGGFAPDAVDSLAYVTGGQPYTARQTLTEAQDWAQANFAKTIDRAAKKPWGEALSEEDALAHLNTINAEVDRIKRAYPNLNPRVGVLHLTKDKTGRANNTLPADEAGASFAQEWQQGSWDWQARWDADHGRPWDWVRAESHTAYNVRHELAHVLTGEHKLIHGEDKRWQKLFAKYGRKKFTDAKGDKVNFWQQKVTEYAATNADEALAECFAIYTSPYYPSGRDLPSEITEFLDLILNGTVRAES